MRETKWCGRKRVVDRGWMTHTRRVLAGRGNEFADLSPVYYVVRQNFLECDEGFLAWEIS